MPWFLTLVGGHMTILHPLDPKYCMQFYSTDSASNFKKEIHSSRMHIARSLLYRRKGSLCPGRGSLSREVVSVQGGGLCPRRESLSKEGVSVQGGSLCPRRESLSRGSLSRGLCPGGLCLGVSVHGALSMGVSVRKTLSPCEQNDTQV